MTLDFVTVVARQDVIRCLHRSMESFDRISLRGSAVQRHQNVVFVTAREVKGFADLCGVNGTGHAIVAPWVRKDKISVDVKEVISM